MYVLWFTCSQRLFIVLALQYFDMSVHDIKDIPETCRAQLIRYLRSNRMLKYKTSNLLEQP